MNNLTPAITPAALARAVGVSRAWIYREIQMGRLRPIPGQRPMGITEAEVRRWINARSARQGKGSAQKDKKGV